MIVESKSTKDTFLLGKRLGKYAKKGELYCLIGELGVGKTIFTQGFATGVGITKVVNSPTFTIIQEYEGGRLPFYHFDVYRIEEIEEMDEIGYEDYFYGNGVCLVEWANRIEELLPKAYKKITIKKQLEKGFDYRIIELQNIEFVERERDIVENSST